MKIEWDEVARDFFPLSHSFEQSTLKEESPLCALHPMAKNIFAYFVLHDFQAWEER